jgi:hypothetical protein
MEIKIFRKIIEFMLTLAVISLLFYARGRASFKHGGGESLHHLRQILCKYYVAIVLKSKRKKMKMKKKYMMRRKRKVIKKEEEKKRKRENEKEIK